MNEQKKIKDTLVKLYMFDKKNNFLTAFLRLSFFTLVLFFAFANMAFAHMYEDFGTTFQSNIQQVDTQQVDTQQVDSRPVSGGIWFQEAHTSLAKDVHYFMNWVLMPVITAVVVLVLILMLYVIIRFNKKTNPVADKFSHNTLIEIIWTVLPVIALIYIGFYSFDILIKQDILPDGKVVNYDHIANKLVFENDFPASRKVAHHKHINVFGIDAGVEHLLKYKVDYKLDGVGSDEIDVLFLGSPRFSKYKIIAGRSVDRNGFVVTEPALTVKVNGFQWGWTYEYPEYGDVSYTAKLLEKDQVSQSDLYLLETDNHVVIPSGITVRFLITSSDVIHSWAIPGFAVKLDAVPGRVNSTWVKVDKGSEGMYYGQCSELCGIDHAYMPISLQVLSLKDYCLWIGKKQDEFAVDKNSVADRQSICVNNKVTLDNNQGLTGL